MFDLLKYRGAVWGSRDGKEFEWWENSEVNEGVVGVDEEELALAQWHITLIGHQLI